MLPPPHAAPRSAASAAENSTPIIAVTSCCRRCEVSHLAALFSVQPHLTEAPFAKVAVAFEPIGFSQCLDAYANHFSIDGERKRFALFQGLADNHRGLLPSRTQSRKNHQSRSASETDSGRTISFQRRFVLITDRPAA